ncbi:MAG: glycerol-3-phosphate acyltransferase [Candidatus Hodarchaeota archaeon]
MDFLDILVGILGILIGYGLGSINPSYFLGKLKGIDIREEGTGNAGTSNLTLVLGFHYGLLAACYDTLKGIAAIFIALGIGADFVFAHISGMAAVVGHIFPFYMHFRGGQGIATATGLMLLYMFTQYFITLEFFYFMLFLGSIYAIFYLASRKSSKKSMPMVFPLPVYGYMIYLHYPDNPYNIFSWIILAFLISFGIYTAITLKLFKIENENFKSSWWRVAIRPVTLLFLLFYFVYSRTVALTLIGIVSLCFIGLDLFRFLHKQTNVLLTEKTKAIFRKGEEKKFSSMTIFIISTFIIILLFEIEIAITALVFLTFGDMFAKIFGLAFGQHKFFDKSVEGTLAYFGTIVICGYFIYTLVDINLAILIAGGVAATFSEALPLGMNDNFTVPMISGSVMSAFMLFGF